MSSVSRDLVFLILQFLDEEKFPESVHKLEQESGYFFNLKYFEEKALLGEWDEVEKYLSAFTNVNDNGYSMRIFFEIRKQKYLEALDRHDRAKALEILVKELKVFSTFNEELYKEIAYLLTLENFRENEKLSKYGDTISARGIVIAELRKLIKDNPMLREKLALPHFVPARLRTLINQSLNWQHQLCKNPRPNPDIKSLFTDHTCSPPNGARAPTPVLPVGAVARPSTYAPLGVHGLPMALAPNANSLAGWMVNSNPFSSVPGGVMASSPFPMHPNQVAMLKHPRPLSDSLGMMDNQSPDQEQLMKRLRFGPTVDEVTYPAHPQPATSLDDLPRNVVSTMHQGLVVTSMDFHPSRHTLLTVGCANGEVTLWEVRFREKVFTEPFNIWNMAACSATCQGSIVKDPSISVSRVSWSPDGNFIGVAFTKHLIHIHAYQGSQLREHLELDAHVGCVNDLAFAHPNKQLCVVTCGDDKCIKVWDLNGKKLYTFEGHEAPVYSICPHQKENVQLIFSTALDGKIMAWLYDNVGSRVDYDAPGKWCTTMLYSADGSRLFSCGTSKDGDSFLVEWNETEGSIKRTYLGFRKKSAGVVQFDTTRNRFLAVGEDNQVKFWDMDNTNLLSAVEADGGLPSLPRLRFNKEGSLLAVTTADNGFKILANVKNGVDAMLRTTEKPRNVESVEKSKPLELMEVVDPAQCQQVTMPECKDSASKVARLLYTNSGVGILALGTNGIQRLWKWSRSEQNPTGKATASMTPQHWQPNNGLLMTNDVPENPEGTVPCIALSKNDSYVISACGGKVSLFNMSTFKVMTTFMPPPPAATFLAFNPQDNNIMAMGMKDSTIHICDVRVDEVKTKLKGHQNYITGLAFSAALNILVSSGADAELFFWSVDSWEKKNSLVIQLPVRKTPIGETRVQFHNDHVQLLVSHETQIAIYDASKMECIHKWVPQDTLSSSITCASYSCNSQQVYASFADGNIGVFDAEYLRPRCRIAPSAYIPPQPTPDSAPIIPLVITTHPQEPNQIAVGLSDGAVKVLATPELLRKQGVAEKTGTENAGPSSSASAANN